MKNCGSEECSNGIGKEVTPVADAQGDKVFLHQFSETTVCNADDDGDEQGFPLVVFPVGNELFTVSPKAKERESGVHDKMHHFVDAHDGLDTWKTRTRKSCQNQDDDSAQDSRVAISGQPFQEFSQS